MEQLLDHDRQRRLELVGQRSEADGSALASNPESNGGAQQLEGVGGLISAALGGALGHHARRQAPDPRLVGWLELIFPPPKCHRGGGDMQTVASYNV